MNWTEIEPQTIALQKALLTTLDNVRKESVPANIPDVNNSLLLAQELLAKPSYDIVVCGEVKKGKSTFINALIGQELLPTGVSETTSQVFRISNSNTESFSLVFTDGTNDSITRDELARYGSQVDANLVGEPMFKDRQLDYIQVNIPIEFLPQGVSIVDTPGLGALYKSHEQITNRYVQNAAAVVFLFDPFQPMVQQEKAFLEKVFAVTPYVMFVMTKIDSVDETSWVAQLSRSETLLKELFGKYCYTLPKIYPVSSTTLFKASQQNDEDEKEELIAFSYFPEAQTELLKIMYRTVGLSRNYFAYDEANKQRGRVMANLDDQLKMITASNKEEQDKIREDKIKIKTTFEQLWSPTSAKRKDVMQEVQTIITSVQNRAAQIVSTTGAIYKNYNSQIDALDSISEIENFSGKLSSNIIRDVSSEWQSIASSAQRDVIKTLGVLKAIMDEVVNSESFSSTDDLSFVELTGSEKFQSYKSKYIDAAITTGVGSSLLALAGVAVAPIAPFIFLGVLIFGIIGGKNNVEQKTIEKNKVNLKHGLSKMMNDINSQMFYVPMSGGNQSLVQSFTSNLASSVERSMSSMYEAQKSQFEKEHHQLDEQARLSAEQKQKELIRVNEQRKQWFAISTELLAEEKLLIQIQTALK